MGRQTPDIGRRNLVVRGNPPAAHVRVADAKLPTRTVGHHRQPPTCHVRAKFQGLRPMAQLPTGHRHPLQQKRLFPVHDLVHRHPFHGRPVEHPPEQHGTKELSPTQRLRVLLPEQQPQTTLLQHLLELLHHTRCRGTGIRVRQDDGRAHLPSGKRKRELQHRW